MEASDAELQEAARARGWERHVVPLGCLPPFVLAVLALVAGGTVGRTSGVLAAGCLIAVLVLQNIVHRRRGPPREELHRRYSLAIDLATMKREDAPDWAILVEDRGLPHGHRRWTRIEVWKEPPRGRFEERKVLSPDGEGIEHAELQRASGTLADEDVDALLARLATPALDAPPPTVIDGHPCAITVLGRGGTPELTGSTNLSGDTESLTARLANAVFDATNRLARGRA